MTREPAGTRIAIAQPVMRWTGEESTRDIEHILALAADHGARLCLLPELALTGFHRQIASQARPAGVSGWLQRVQAACAASGVAAALGAPSFDDAGRIFNSHLLIDENGGAVATVPKRGLTDPEATFFARGGARPVVPLLGLRCTAVICREVEDADVIVPQLQGQQPQLVFWPGLMAPDPAKPVQDPPEHVSQAMALARRLGVWVLQSNWPMSLNYPELGAETGCSVVIDPEGGLRLRLPKAQAGLAVFDLGDEHFEWLPLAVD